MHSLLRPDLVEIGHMNPGRWRHIADVYADLGMIERDFSLGGFLYDPAPRPDRRLTAAAAASTGVALVFAAVIVGFVGLTRKLRLEIDVRQQAEAELRESDKKFRAIADTAPIALLITRPRGRPHPLRQPAAADLAACRLPSWSAATSPASIPIRRRASASSRSCAPTAPSATRWSNSPAPTARRC
jgi:PAS domain-containing protein